MCCLYKLVQYIFDFPVSSRDWLLYSRCGAAGFLAFLLLLCVCGARCGHRYTSGRAPIYLLYRCALYSLSTSTAGVPRKNTEDLARGALRSSVRAPTRRAGIVPAVTLNCRMYIGRVGCLQLRLSLIVHSPAFIVEHPLRNVDGYDTRS